MLHHLRHRAADHQGQEGFTLVELLVVILVVGILAAVAIPTFLSQTNKSSDTNLESALGTAHTSEATYRVQNGSYANTTSALTAIEPSLSTPVTNYGITVSYWAPNNGTASSTTGYTLSGRNPKSGVTFTLNYDAGSGTVQRQCSPSGTGACSASSTWGS